MDHNWKGLFMVEKSNNWIAILYPENMVDNWQKIIASVLEI